MNLALYLARVRSSEVLDGSRPSSQGSPRSPESPLRERPLTTRRAFRHLQTRIFDTDRNIATQLRVLPFPRDLSRGSYSARSYSALAIRGFVPRPRDTFLPHQCGLRWPQFGPEQDWSQTW